MASRAGTWAVATVVAAGVLLAVLMSERTPPPIGPGQSAPGFSLPRLRDGARVSLGDFEGRVVLLNFWATWCKPCEDEMPAMERLYRRLKGAAPFELVAVSVDENRAAVEAFRERLDLTFPILLDPAARTARSYQTTGYPESFLIDRAGTLRARYVGPREWDAPAYERRIRRLLEEGERAVWRTSPIELG